MGFSTLDTHTAEGKARREAAEKRETAGGNAHKMNLVHVSGGGGRSSGTGAAPAHKSAGGAKSLGGSLAVSSSSAVAAPESSSGSEARKSSTNVLGGSSAVNAQPMSDAELRAKRAAHFEKMATDMASAKSSAAGAKPA